MARAKLPRAVPKTAPWAAAMLAVLALLVWAGHATAPSPYASISLSALDAGPLAPAPPVATRPSPRFCDADAGCDGGPCTLGRCQSATAATGPHECARDADCGFAMRCDLGLCLDGARTCTSDSVCDVGERCAGGRCASGVRTCAAPTDCPRTSHCHLGACEDGPAPPDGGCHNDRACPNGRCAGGACLPEPRECLDGRDCPGDFRCDQGLCRPVKVAPSP